MRVFIFFFCLIANIIPATAQEIIGFPREDFGKVVLSGKQSFTGKLESSYGNYNNEPISNYNKRSIFARLGRAVGRLDILTNIRVFPCTGFLISDKYLITNYHCVPGILEMDAVRERGATRIDGVQIVLGYTREGIEEDASRYTVSPTPVEKSKKLDYAILEVFGRPSDKFGTVKIASAEPYPNQPFFIIGHPLGLAQKISREKCMSASPAISGGQVRHKCDTLPGNSGSPVFDQDTRSAIALHHAGSSRNSINYAIPFSRIVKQSLILRELIRKEPTLRKQQAALEEEQKKKRIIGAAAWGIAARADSIPGFETYLEKHKQGQHVEQAKQRLSELHRKQIEHKKLIARSLASKEQAERAVARRHKETLAWTKAAAIDHIKNYNSFIANWPQSDRLPQAHDRVAKLTKLSSRWEILRFSRRISEVRTFFHNAENSRYHSIAQVRLQTLEQAEKKAWNKADSIPLLKEYKKFIKNWPEGNFAQKANQKIESIEAIGENWHQLRMTESELELEAFIEEYGWSEYGGEATARLASLRREKKLPPNIKARTLKASELVKLLNRSFLIPLHAGGYIRFDTKAMPRYRKRLGRRFLRRLIKEKFVAEGGFQAVMISGGRERKIEGLAGIIESQVDKTGSLFLMQMHGTERRAMDVDRRDRKFLTMVLVHDGSGYICDGTDWHSLLSKKKPRLVTRRCRVGDLPTPAKIE